MKDAEIKDKILQYLTESSTENTVAMAYELNLDHESFLKAIREMTLDCHVIELEEINTGKYDFATGITERGELFIVRGGYTVALQKDRRQQLKKAILEWSTVMIGVVTCVSGVWQIVLTNRTNQLEEKNNRLQQQVDSLIKHPTIQNLYFPADALKQRDSVPE